MQNLKDTKASMSFEALIASIKGRPAPKRTKAKDDSDIDKLSQSLADKINAELQWQQSAITLLIVDQQCACGAWHTGHTQGVFLTSKHRGTGALRHLPLKSAPEAHQLPHEVEHRIERIALCGHCALENDVVDTLLGKLPDRARQLHLFPSEFPHAS
jgi:hypothetical protein